MRRPWPATQRVSNRSRRDLFGRAFLVAILCACSATAGRAQIVIEDGGEILLEVRAGQLASRTVLGHWMGGEVLLPARPLFDFLEMGAEVDESGRLELAEGAHGPRVLVDTPNASLSIGGERIPLDEEEWDWTGVELYLGTRTLARILSRRILVDVADLTVTVEPVEDLPIGRRLARERAREVLLVSATRTPPDRVFAPERSLIDGAALSWSVSTPLEMRAEDFNYRLGFGSNLLGGALDLRARNSSRTDSWTGSWVKAWPERSWLRQARLGFIAGTGPRPRPLKGIAVSNSPFLRSAAFGETSISGRLTPGWEVEVWQEGSLVGFVRADERGFFEVPVSIDYGPNDVEIQAYGPHGEVQWLSQAVQVDADRLPAGEFEYQTSWGRCQNEDGTSQTNLDLRYGLNQTWTMRVGAEAFVREDEPDLIHPYASVLAAFRHRWRLRAESVIRALHGLRVDYEPTADFRTSVSHTLYDTSVESPVLTAVGRRTRSQGTLFWRPNARRRGRFVELGYLRLTAEGWSQDRSLLRYHLQSARVRWTADWEEAQTESGSSLTRTSVFGVGASTSLPRSLPVAIGGLYVRGSLAYELRESEIYRTTLSLGKSLGQTGHVELSVGWSSPLDSPFLNLRLSSTGFGFHSSSQVMRGADGDISGATQAEGSIMWNEAGGQLQTFPFQALGRGGVSGTVFVDENGNGWPDPGEAPLPGVRIRAGARTVRTDALGRYSMWDFVPFEAMDLTVEAASVDDPLLIPEFSRASVVVAPNGYREVNLPMTPGVELGGWVFRDGPHGRVGVGGVPITLRHVESGKKYETKSFRDGELYFMSLPPGDYQISIAPRVLARLGMRMQDQGAFFRLALPEQWDQLQTIEVKLIAKDETR
jgi:hypothetical protein